MLAPETRMKPTQEKTKLRGKSKKELKTSAEHLDQALPAAHNPQASSFMSKYNTFLLINFILLW